MAYKKPILIVDLKGSLKTPLLDFKICLNIELSRSLGVTLTFLYLGPFFKNLSSLMFMLYMIKKIVVPPTGDSYVPRTRTNFKKYLKSLMFVRLYRT